MTSALTLLAFTSYFEANLLLDFAFFTIFAFLILNDRPWAVVAVFALWLVPVLVPLPEDAYISKPPPSPLPDMTGLIDKVQQARQLSEQARSGNLQGVDQLTNSITSANDIIQEQILDRLGIESPLNQQEDAAAPAKVNTPTPPTDSTASPNAPAAVLSHSGATASKGATLMKAKGPGNASQIETSGGPEAETRQGLLERDWLSVVMNRIDQIVHPSEESAPEITLRLTDAATNIEALWLFMRLSQITGLIVLFFYSRAIGTLMLGCMIVPFHYYIAALSYYFDAESANQVVLWFGIIGVIVVLSLGIIGIFVKLVLNVLFSGKTAGYPNPGEHRVLMHDKYYTYTIDDNHMLHLEGGISLRLKKAAYDDNNPNRLHLDGGGVIEFVPKG